MNKWLIGGISALALIAASIWGVVTINHNREKHEQAIVMEARSLALKEFEAAMTKKLAEQGAKDDKKFSELKASIDAKNAATIATLANMQRAQTNKTEALEKSLRDLKDGPLSEQAKEYFKREAE